MSSLGIYIHVPFCGRKCAYCDFYSTAYSRQAADGYISAVLRNLRHYSDRTRPTDTLYFGGGTPSLLTPDQLGNIITEVRTDFNLTPTAEITLEANPSALTRERLEKLRETGINRLSIGVQSMRDDELRFLDRTHDSARAERTVREAHAAGFGNISCDLMLALPGQTRDALLYSIDRLAELPIQHISAYILKVEDGTPFARDGIASQLPDGDLTAELYLAAVEALESRGFSQYEISNFARPGFESRHNTRYWKCEDYLGIGPAAHSCCGGVRFAVPRDLQAFIDSPVQPTEVTDDSPCSSQERIMLGLRLTEGIALSDFPDERSAIEKKIPALESAGYCRFDGERLSLTPRGFLMSNQIIGFLAF